MVVVGWSHELPVFRLAEEKEGDLVVDITNVKKPHSWIIDELRRVIDLDKYEEGKAVYFPGTGKRKVLNPFGLDAKNQFEFGDIRIELESRFIVVEVDKGEGIYNLIKYWPYFVNCKKPKPITLLHVYYHQSEGNYKAYRELWEFMKKRIVKEVGEHAFNATKYEVFDSGFQAEIEKVQRRLIYELGLSVKTP